MENGKIGHPSILPGGADDGSRGTILPDTLPLVFQPQAGVEDQAAIGVGWTISILCLLPGTPSRVPSVSRSGAVNVWRKADTGMRTDEAHVGQRGLHRDPSVVKTSSQSIHRNTSLSFTMSSA